MSARMKLNLLVAAFVCANLAIWGVKHVLAGALDPVLRALGQ
jgi:hypothetical protein